MFYYPTRIQYHSPDQLGLKYDEILLTSTDRYQIVVWHIYVPEVKPRAVVVQFHGNGQNLSAHYLSTSWLVRLGFDVFIFDYRGYGASEGKAQYDGIYEDSRTVAEHLPEFYRRVATRSSLSQNLPLVLLGQSLGGAVLLKLIEDHELDPQARCVVVDSGFRSYKAMARSVAQTTWVGFLFAPVVGWLVSDRYAADVSRIKLSAPLIVIHAKGDSVVPVKMGRELHRDWNGPKFLWERAGREHVTSFRDPKDQQQFLKLLDDVCAIAVR